MREREAYIHVPVCVFVNVLLNFIDTALCVCVFVSVFASAVILTFKKRSHHNCSLNMRPFEQLNHPCKNSNGGQLLTKLFLVRCVIMDCV